MTTRRKNGRERIPRLAQRQQFPLIKKIISKSLFCHARVTLFSWYYTGFYDSLYGRCNSFFLWLVMWIVSIVIRLSLYDLSAQGLNCCRRCQPRASEMQSSLRHGCLQRSHGGATTPGTGLGKSLLIQVGTFNAPGQISLYLRRRGLQ